MTLSGAHEREYSLTLYSNQYNNLINKQILLYYDQIFTLEVSRSLALRNGIHEDIYPLHSNWYCFQENKAALCSHYSQHVQNVHLTAQLAPFWRRINLYLTLARLDSGLPCILGHNIYLLSKFNFLEEFYFEDDWFHNVKFVYF